MTDLRTGWTGKIIQANFALQIRTNHQMIQLGRNRHHLPQIRIDLMVYKNLWEIRPIGI